MIELLVVVTIIVVLLALLAPALDRAIYQAELAVCATRLGGIATAVNLYASEQRRAYPYRMALDPNPKPRMGLVGGEGGLTSSWVRWGRPDVLVDELEDAPIDDRPVLAGPLGAKQFQVLHDPLTGGDVDFTVNDFSIFVDYNLWFGIRYQPAVGGGRGLLRLGDRFEFQGDGYNVLASDRDALLPNSTGWQKAIASHADHDDVLYPLVAKVSANWFVAWWEANATHLRGPLDTNYAYTDGSVTRFNSVTWNDDRMAHLPANGNAVNYNGGSEAGPSYWLQAPRP